MTMCLAVPLVLILLPVIFNNTPGHIILGMVLPTMYHSPILLSVLSAIYLGTTGFFASFCQLQILLLLIIILLESQYLLRAGYRKSGQWKMTQDDHHKNLSNNKQIFKKVSQQSTNPASGDNSVGTNANTLDEPLSSDDISKVMVSMVKMKAKYTVSFRNGYSIYLQTKLIFCVFNQLVFVFFPLSMFVGFTLNVLITFICIKMYHQLPIMIISTLFFVNFFVSVLTVLFHTAAMIIAEECTRFCGYWKTRIVTTLDRDRFFNCQIIRVKIGSFFWLQRTTLLNTILAVLDNLVNLLLIEM